MNTLNTFNQLRFNKFIENVVGEFPEPGESLDITTNTSVLDNTTFSMGGTSTKLSSTVAE